MTRIDPYTNEEFIPQRRNQIFKSWGNRVAYNNEKAAQIRDSKAYIDKILLKNYKIIKELVKPGERKTIHKNILLERGFNFAVATHNERFEGDTHKCLYNFIFLPSKDKDTIIIVGK